MLQDVRRNEEYNDSDFDLLPSSSFAITTPLPARAENTKPALNIVKMANPLAFSRTDRGITPSRPLLPLSTNDLTAGVITVKPSHTGTNTLANNLQILAAFMHSLGNDCGNGLLSFMTMIEMERN